jgi:hypothetical protein
MKASQEELCTMNLVPGRRTEVCLCASLQAVDAVRSCGCAVDVGGHNVRTSGTLQQRPQDASRLWPLHSGR